jgi:hypothetical protein
MEMAVQVGSTGRISEAEPIGLLTEGAAGIAVIVLTVVALAGISTEPLGSIAAIVIGVGLMFQAFNSALEAARVVSPNMALIQQGSGLDGEVMVDCLCGLTGIVLGVLALVGINAAHLLPAALIVFGGSLLLSGAIRLQPKIFPLDASGTETRFVSSQGPMAAGGVEVLVGLAAIVLGILSLMLAAYSILVLVGFLAVGATLLLVSASFSGAVLRLFATG